MKAKVMETRIQQKGHYKVLVIPYQSILSFEVERKLKES